MADRRRRFWHACASQMDNRANALPAPIADTTKRQVRPKATDGTERSGYRSRSPALHQHLADQFLAGALVHIARHRVGVMGFLQRVSGDGRNVGFLERLQAVRDAELGVEFAYAIDKPRGKLRLPVTLFAQT